MKLLVITQKVDLKDPVLGFFHRWIEELSKHCEKVTVTCLFEGEHRLPNNVKVLSLGKERGSSKIKYIFNFYKHIFNERRNYDKVFVHMNQEYVLMGGMFWKFLGKDVFMWRNHHAGSFFTDDAAALCKKVFCTSIFSYTAKYKKTVIMPVGVDIENFKPNSSVSRIPNSILSLGRISPSKNIDVLVDGILKLNDSKLTVNIYGDALLQDEGYYEDLKKKAGNNIIFHKGIPNAETVNVYSTHSIFVNLSSSGMYDKTIFEAMACGCLVLASNKNLVGKISDDFIFEERNTEEFVRKLQRLLSYSEKEYIEASDKLKAFAQSHALDVLGKKIIKEMSHE